MIDEISDQTHALVYFIFLYRYLYSDPLQRNGYRLGARNILQYIIIIIMYLYLYAIRAYTTVYYIGVNLRETDSSKSFHKPFVFSNQLYYISPRVGPPQV